MRTVKSSWYQKQASSDTLSIAVGPRITVTLNRVVVKMTFFITMQHSNSVKRELERVISESPAVVMECCICVEPIDHIKNRGVVVITSNGIADLGRMFCAECDVRFRNKTDPFKRDIRQRYRFPFDDEETAVHFLNNTTSITLNSEDKEQEVLTDINRTKDSGVARLQDVEYTFDPWAFLKGIKDNE